MPQPVIPVVLAWGTPQHLRYVVCDTNGRFWTGSGWSSRQRDAVLFADHSAAGSAAQPDRLPPDPDPVVLPQHHGRRLARPPGAGESERRRRERQHPPHDQRGPDVDARPLPTSGPTEDRVHPLGLEPPLPPADGTQRAEQHRTDGRPREPGVEQQENVRPEANLGQGVSAVVVEEFLALCQGEANAGHGQSPSSAGLVGKSSYRCQYGQHNDPVMPRPQSSNVLGVLRRRRGPDVEE
jgi:hypothetical protein